jgi:rhodanese-related sulfurtransferase
MRASPWLLLATLVSVGCGSDSDEPSGNHTQLEAGADATAQLDASNDAGPDTSTPDATPDASTPDATPDASTPDATPDASTPDATPDTSTPDATPDTSTPDATPDASTPDAAPDASTSDASNDADLADVISADASDGLSPYACPINVAQTLQTATVDDLHTAILAGDDLEVVDVREPSETSTGVIGGALLYPWNSGVLQAEHASLPTGAPLYVICASGGRSLPASTFLVQQGHTCVFNVQGGMNAWKGAGYPTATP